MQTSDATNTLKGETITIDKSSYDLLIKDVKEELFIPFANIETEYLRSYLWTGKKLTILHEDKGPFFFDNKFCLNAVNPQFTVVYLEGNCLDSHVVVTTHHSMTNERPLIFTSAKTYSLKEFMNSVIMQSCNGKDGPHRILRNDSFKLAKAEFLINVGLVSKI